MKKVNNFSKYVKRLMAKTNLRVLPKRGRKCLSFAVLTMVVITTIYLYAIGFSDIILKVKLKDDANHEYTNTIMGDKTGTNKEVRSRGGIVRIFGTKVHPKGATRHATHANLPGDDTTETKKVKGLERFTRSSSFQYSGIHELETNVGETEFEPFCNVELNRDRFLTWPDTPTDFTDWSFKIRRKCPKFVINDGITNKTRIKYSLHCSTGKAQLVPSNTTSSNDVDVVTSNNSCLSKFIDSCCRKGEDVPNVIHYVWYFKKSMKFDTFLSILSVVRFVRPCLILFHGEYLPYGVYWDYIVRLYPNIIHVKTPRPLTISGKKIQHHEHSGDVMRIKALISYGGVYLDTDVIALRDLKPLRQYDITLCKQGGKYLLNSFIMSKKNATFLTLWLDGYKKDYRNDSYVYNSMVYNNDLSRKYPNLIHIEKGTMCCPDEFLGVNFRSPVIYNWTKLYGFHIYSRQINFPWNVDLIRNFNTTFGSMLRHVIYGNKELCL